MTHTEQKQKHTENVTKIVASLISTGKFTTHDGDMPTAINYHDNTGEFRFIAVTEAINIYRCILTDVEAKIGDHPRYYAPQSRKKSEDDQ